MTIDDPQIRHLTPEACFHTSADAPRHWDSSRNAEASDVATNNGIGMRSCGARSQIGNHLREVILQSGLAKTSSPD
jgi:hypothetical protein